MFLLLALAACSTQVDAAPDTTDQGPLVLELFTSQGCSSCPPADQLLSKLAKATSGRPLAPLSFHVDYWNDLGWADPYSQAAWTERQRQYATALGDKGVYTPELVVGGAKGFVGSHTKTIEKAIDDAPRPALLKAASTWRNDKLEVTATAPADAEILVALYEDGRRIAVTRGENGSTLTNDRVVRRLERVAKAGNKGTVTVAIDPSWKNVGAVAFAQRTDKRIVASAFLR
jgi:hypothetical protein